MQRKLVGYFLLSFFSFCFFTAVLNVIAVAQVSADQSAPQKAEIVRPAQIVPTPTIYNTKSNISSSQTQTLVQDAPPSSPTPTLYVVQQVPAAAPQVQTNEQEQKITATPPPPTATPTPTIAPTATPTQAPQPTIATTTDLETLFGKYSSQFSISEDELKKIANCESGFNSASDTGTYAGMFQFSQGTWASTRSAMGLDTNADLRKNPEEAIRTAAFMLARGEQNAWPNCH